jgi:hypothetical protein
MDALSSQSHRYQCFIDPSYVARAELPQFPEQPRPPWRKTEIATYGDGLAAAGTRNESFVDLLRARINECE